MAAIESRQVGRTRLQVTSLGLGSAPIGNDRSQEAQSKAIATLQTAFEHGVKFFDTAPLYGAGLSEQLIGTALAGVPRDSFVLATKVGRLVQPDGTVTFDFTRDGVLRSIDESLRRLSMDRIDILHVHDPDDAEQAALGEAFPTLLELRRQGVIGAIGSGMNQYQMLTRFVEQIDLDCLLLAGRYTILEQGGAPLLELCRERQIGAFLGGVYNSGILAMGPRPGATYNYSAAPAEIVARVQQLDAVCQRHGVPLRVAATQFAAAHPGATALIIGAITPDEALAAIDALAAPIPAALWDDLRSSGLIDACAPTPA